MSLGSADPKTKKAKAENARFFKYAMNPDKQNAKAAAMPEWAFDEARRDARRQKSKGWVKPLQTAYKDWPKARTEYLTEWAK